jgi:hypothetical protein
VDEPGIDDVLIQVYGGTPPLVPGDLLLPHPADAQQRYDVIGNFPS